MGLLYTVLLAIGALVVIFTIAELTPSLLKNYRKKQNDPVLAATAKALIKAAPHLSMETLDKLNENPEATFIAEYDDDQDCLVQHDFSETTEIGLSNTLKKNGGCVVFE